MVFIEHSTPVMFILVHERAASRTRLPPFLEALHPPALPLLVCPLVVFVAPSPSPCLRENANAASLPSRLCLAVCPLALFRASRLTVV